LTEKVLDRMIAKVEDIAKSAALATGCKLELNVLRDLAYAPFHPNHTLGNAFRANLESLGVTVSEAPEDEHMGSSDVGNVGRVVPTIHPEFAISTLGVFNHTPEFAVAAGTDEAIDATLKMAKAMALTAISIFEHRELIESIRAEFESVKKGD
jgi:metal-dependent amidase/aminoacylase/carboxypeptidase family protein